MSKVTAKYQITIPLKIRKELSIVPGTEVDIAKKGDQYLLVIDPIKGLRKKWSGMFRDNQTTMDYINDIRGEVD